MQELELDFGIEHTGYRLAFFQCLNWGTFDNHIVTLKVDGKNSLLTGTNGSGKTTLVDGLLTLLVPAKNRTYNLSSGNEGKSGRTEESYVLGTYSTSKNKDDYSASKKTLRDKNCQSILLATFSNETAANSLTLMQIRYFSSNGTMKKQYFIIEGSLTIEMLQENKLGYNPTSNWIQEIKKTFSDFEINTFDTFKRYSYEFSKKFGFRSQDKALKIFSQTVGMKDLTDLNEFIRTKMLDEEDIYSQYLKILKNYHNLMELKNIIDKEEIQIDILQRIKETGIKFLNNENILFNKKQTRDKVLPIWEAQTAFELLTNDIKYITEQKEIEEDKVDQLKDRKRALYDEIEDIKMTLHSDERTNRIVELKKNRDLIKSIINQKEPNKSRYMKIVESLGLPFPNDNIEFNKNKKTAQDKIEIIKGECERLEEERSALISEKGHWLSQKTDYEKQLEAIQNKESNIPLNYLLIRDQLCEDTNLAIDDIRYVGELIQVKEECLEKSSAIESILQPFALTLLTLPQNLTKVATWLNDHKLKERIEVIVIENMIAPTIIKGDDKDQLSLLENDDDEILFEEQLPIHLNMMVEIKENYEYSYFLSQLLEKNFKLELTQNKHILFDRDGVFSDEALAHCNKKLIKGITDEEQDFRVLGWDTGKKKARLKDNISNLSSMIKSIEEDITHYVSKISKLYKTKQYCESIQNFEDFEKINTHKEEDQIAAIDSQLIELSEETSDLAILEEKLRESQQTYFDMDEEIRRIDKNIGASDHALEIKRAQKENYQQVLDTDLTSFFEPISDLVIDYSIPTKFANVEEIARKKANIETQINIEINSLSKEVIASEKALMNHMNSFIRPSQDYLAKYPSWTYDTKDLTIDTSALKMYEALLDKLQKDSLPSYKEQFKKLQTSQMEKDIVDLNTGLNRWDKNIKTNIKELNESLDALDYQKDPKTKIRITLESVKDSDIRLFKKLLDAAQPDKGIMLKSNQEEMENERFMMAVEKLILKLKNDDNFTMKVLDVRKWHNYAVEEYLVETNEQYRFYADSNGISGGQKAKLAYTILAAAVAHQFDVFNTDNKSKAFRFVIIDEAFSKSDDTNSKYALNLFKAMDLQFMVVTPMDKVNLVEPFIETIQVAVCEDNKHSFVHSLKKEELIND